MQKKSPQKLRKILLCVCYAMQCLLCKPYSVSSVTALQNRLHHTGSADALEGPASVLHLQKGLCTQWKLNYF